MTIEIVGEKKPVENLDLIVIEKSAGTLETNIGELEKFIDERLEDYTPEKFKGNADSAKKKRAELNAGREKIKRSRIDLINELMKPYAEFENRCKALEKKIDTASAALDEIVKTKENEEKDNKRKKIELFWKMKEFDLFPLEKIFNEKWLNKTYKESDILDEMDAAIERTYKDLKSIEMFNTKEDVETLKAHYLMNLDIAETIEYSKELTKQKEIAEREAKEREEREHNSQIQKQISETNEEKVNLEKERDIDNLAEMALAASKGVKADLSEKRQEYVITVNLLQEELIKLKSVMNALGIEYAVEQLQF